MTRSHCRKISTPFHSAQDDTIQGFHPDLRSQALRRYRILYIENSRLSSSHFHRVVEDADPYKGSRKVIFKFAISHGRSKPLPYNLRINCFGIRLSTDHCSLFTAANGRPPLRSPYIFTFSVSVFNFQFSILSFQFFLRRRDPACGALRVRQAQDDPSGEGRRIPKRFFSVLFSIFNFQF